MNPYAHVAILNRELALRDSARAAEIEWVVDDFGKPVLRDRPEWSRSNQRAMERRRERERDEHHRRIQDGRYTDPRQGEL